MTGRRGAQSAPGAASRATGVTNTPPPPADGSEARQSARPKQSALDAPGPAVRFDLRPRLDAADAGRLQVSAPVSRRRRPRSRPSAAAPAPAPARDAAPACQGVLSEGRR